MGFLPGDPADVGVVAADQKPQQVWVRNREDGGPSGWLHPVTTVLATDDPEHVVARAMTRPPQLRFDPMACTDEDGTYVGLVHVEHLVTATVTADRS
jgi:hypothetical protein